jgi:hypothetical protein
MQKQKPFAEHFRYDEMTTNPKGHRLRADKLRVAGGRKYGECGQCNHIVGFRSIIIFTILKISSWTRAN